MYILRHLGGGIAEIVNMKLRLMALCNILNVSTKFMGINWTKHVYCICIKHQAKFFFVFLGHLSWSNLRVP